MGVDERSRRVRNRRRPRSLYRRPSVAQTLGCLRVLQLAAGELPVELGVDEGSRDSQNPIETDA
jgi:hypothetical protein